MPDRVPDWVLERFLLGELPADRQARVAARLTRDEGLQGRLAALQASNEDILATLPPARQAAAAGQSLWNPVSIGAGAVVLLALGLAAWLGTRPEPSQRLARFLLIPDEPVGRIGEQLGQLFESALRLRDRAHLDPVAEEHDLHQRG